MRGLVRAAAWMAACGLVSTAAAQFNIDLSVNSASTAAPAPDSTYGAAAGQPGFWNNFNATGVTGAALSNLAGNTTGVTFTMSTGGFMFDSPNNIQNAIKTPTSSNEERLMDDVWDSPANATVTFGNLPAGGYSLYVYGGSPDSNTVFMNFIVNGNSQLVGGPWTDPFDGPEDYVQGVTHALFSVNHAGGDLVVTMPEVVGFEGVNGFQIAPIPEPTSLAAIACGGLVAFRRRRR